MTPSRYNIALLAPPNYPHAMAFREVAILLVASLESLGLPVTFQINTLDPAAVNIILGYHLIQTPSTLRNIRYIPYQLEQFSPESPWFTPRALEVLQNAQEVWDYSPANIQRLAAHNIRAKLLPLGYHEKLRLIPQLPEAQQDIDILHYGNLNPRRQSILQQLAGHCRLMHVDCLYAEPRDALIARAKLVLSIHFYQARLPAQVRISYLVNNAWPVLAETAADPAADPFHNLVATADYEQLAPVALDLLRNPDQRHRWAASAHEAFKQRPMADNLRVVLA